ncbi:MAG: DegV family EDD domain-containing protein [Promicromonosporaceae bacterium]|nr:DegV family EDD domain-containing protein [Promicromonosporaceae bacterium]
MRLLHLANLVSPAPAPVTAGHDARHPAVRVVTDTTACLPAPASAGPAAPVVVPLRVLTPDGELREGVDVTPAQVAARIAAGQRLTTSQPSPEDFADSYRAIAQEGAAAIVSVHLSGALSGTVEAAAHAGQRAMLPVRAVDSHTVAMALGFAAQQAAACAAAGSDAEHVAARATAVAASPRPLLPADSLAHPRPGGGGVARGGGGLFLLLAEVDAFLMLSPISGSKTAQTRTVRQFYKAFSLPMQSLYKFILENFVIHVPFNNRLFPFSPTFLTL